MNRAGIYKITSPSNKVYIGQSWYLDKRISYYKNLPSKSQRRIYNSIMKYGWEKHKFEIIHELPLDATQEVMDRYEILYWELYKDCGVEMLNIRNPGKGRGNGGYSEETKLIMRNNNLGKKLSKETRLKLSKAHKGKVFSKETREKLRASNIAKKRSPTTKDRISKSKSKSVIQLDLQGNFIKEWTSRILAAKSFGGTSQSNITNVCNGLRKTAYKFKWKDK